MRVKKHKPRPFDVDLTGLKLPKDFMFGVCNSPYHSEGGYNTDYGPHNNWSVWENTGLIEKSGEANRFWDDYLPYIHKSKEIGLNAFRMGFEWGRVQPSFHMNEGPEPDWDESAFDRYAEIVGAVYEAEMEPVITLHHFTHPAWIGPHLWPHDEKVEQFMAYIKRVVIEVNNRLVKAGHPAIRFYVVLNEPFNALAGPYLFGDAPPGGIRNDVESFEKATINMLWAYVQTYDFIYDVYEQNGWRQPHVGFNIVSYSIYELDKMYLDLVRAPSLGVKREEVSVYLQKNKFAFNEAMNPLARKRLNWFQFWYWNKTRNHYGEMYDKFDYSKLLDTLYASPRKNKLDYIAIDCYDPFIIASVSFADVYMPKRRSGPSDRFDWTKLSFDPDVTRDHLYVHAKDLKDIPLYILETTIGNNQRKFGAPEPRPDGLTREIFLKEILRECVRLIQQGTPLKGFLYWTLCDNYEWGTYTSRLGLVEYDYENHVIKDTDAFGLPMLRIYRDLIAALRSNDPCKIREAFTGDA